MRSWLALGSVSILLWAAEGRAGTVVMATGDCRDTELLGSMQIFTDALKARLGDRLMGEAGVLERFRPRPGMSLEEVQRLLEASEVQFLDGQTAKVLQSLAIAEGELDKFSPASRPWRLRAGAWTLHGRVLRSQGKQAEAAEWFRRVLRVDSGYKLDPLVCPPSQVAQFEALRRELAAAPRHSLTVTSPVPGAEVFVDGAVVGKTPFTGGLPPGDYAVALVAQDAVSFTRTVELRADAALHVDLGFESAVSGRPPLCVYSSGMPAQLDHALRFAGLLEADEAVVLRLEARSNEPGWVTAALMDLKRGTRLREGGMKAVAGWSGEGLEDLAEFVVTGHARRSVVAIDAKGTRTSAEEAPAAAVSKPPAPAPGAALVPAPVATVAPSARPDEHVVQASAEKVADPKGTSTKWMRWGGVVLAGLGVVSAEGAGLIWLVGGSDRQRLGQLLDDQGRLPPKGTAENVEALALNRAQNQRSQWVTGLAVGGGAAVVVGAGLWLLVPDAKVVPAVAVLPGGTSVGVTGRF